MNRISLSLDAFRSAFFDDVEALNRVLATLDHPSASMRRRGAAALGRLLPAAALVAPALIGHLDDADPKVRELCAVALKRLGATALPQLAEGIDEACSSRIRSACLVLVGVVEPLAPAALPALSRALRDHDPDVRRAAAWALLQGRSRGRRRRSYRSKKTHNPLSESTENEPADLPTELRRRGWPRASTSARLSHAA